MEDDKDMKSASLETREENSMECDKTVANKAGTTVNTTTHTLEEKVSNGSGKITYGTEQRAKLSTLVVFMALTVIWAVGKNTYGIAQESGRTGLIAWLGWLPIACTLFILPYVAIFVVSVLRTRSLPQWRRDLHFRNRGVIFMLVVFALAFAQQSLDSNPSSASTSRKVSVTYSVYTRNMSVTLFVLATLLWSGMSNAASRITLAAGINPSVLVVWGYFMRIGADDFLVTAKTSMRGELVAILAHVGFPLIWAFGGNMLCIYGTRTQILAWQALGDPESKLPSSREIQMPQQGFFPQLYHHVCTLQTGFAKFVWWIYFPAVLILERIGPYFITDVPFDFDFGAAATWISVVLAVLLSILTTHGSLPMIVLAELHEARRDPLVRAGVAKDSFVHPGIRKKLLVDDEESADRLQKEQDHDGGVCG